MSQSTVRLGSQRALGRNLLLAAAMVVSAGALMSLASPGRAQPAPPAQPDTGATIWGKGGCFNCHGNLAAGDGDPSYPQGPNLRQTRLTRDQLIETISCGRPGTPMPFNLAGAYTQTACYAMPLGPPPEVSRGASFSAEQIQVLVDFLVQNVVGKSNITRENCAVFFNGNANAPLCRQF